MPSMPIKGLTVMLGFGVSLTTLLAMLFIANAIKESANMLSNDQESIIKEMV